MPELNGTVSVENIIYGSFVKMNRLEPIVYETFGNSSISSATELNIYVDLYSVLKSIFSEHYRTDISDYTAITSGIINLCSHYRHFFRRLQVKTNFFLIFSFNTCDINRKFVAEYNESFKKKSEIQVFRDVAMNNFELLDLLCPYLPDIHFIKSIRNYESAVIMGYLIEKSIPNKIPNLIISKDLYPLQLTAIYPYTSYLYPIKKRGGIDESLMVPINEKYNFRQVFWQLFCHIRKIDINKVIDINPINFSLLSAIIRFPERGLTSLGNINIAKKIIEKLNGNEIEIFPDMLYNDPEISEMIPVNLIDARLKALQVQYMAPIYGQDPECLSIRLENLKDPNAINQINSKFFAHNPIDIYNL